MMAPNCNETEASPPHRVVTAPAPSSENPQTGEARLPRQAVEHRLALVAAVDAHMTIGFEGHMPWHFPEDLRYFKELTLGHDVIMGRVTFEAIGNPLPGRRNMVVSRNAAWRHTGCEVFDSLTSAIDASKDTLPCIIGGASLYAESISLATDLYLTHIDATFAGDRFFPELGPNWQLVSERKGVSGPLRFCHYQRSRAT